MSFELKSITEIEQRQAVITEIERAVFTRRYNLSSKHYSIFAKNSISMLYAIWEGFIQTIFGLYIDEINAINPRLFELHQNIIIFCNENEFPQFLEYPRKSNKKLLFLKKLRTHFSNEHYKIPRQVNTKSNVSLEVLNNLLEQFNIETYPDQWDDYKYPKPNLRENLSSFLRIRNSISHGGELLPGESINQEDYERFKRLCIKLMYDIRNKMINASNKKSFLN